MRINQEGLDIIKSFEGYSSSVYLCPANRWTIGYGSTWDKNGESVTKDHPDINEEEGEFLLRRELKHCDQSLARLVTSELNENMY